MQRAGFAIGSAIVASIACGEATKRAPDPPAPPLSIWDSADGECERPGFYIGADITSVQAAEARGVTYSDGETRDILVLLRDHGFNYIRLRTFVDPRAEGGYDRQQGFGDLEHTIAFGQRIKAAGMGFLLDFHYSDTWADPGKQCIPASWRGMSLDQLVGAVQDYTRDAITQLVAAGARPDMVQLGNEITPGMLINDCGDRGQALDVSPVNGSIENWDSLGALLRAASGAVRSVDPRIKLMLHLDRGGDKPTDPPGLALQLSTDFINNAQAQGVDFDVFGESCYQSFQGDPESADNTVRGWADTFGELALRFPDLRWVAAEYGPLQRELNDVLFELPGERGVGSFAWEPIREGFWNTGHALFSSQGDPRLAGPDLALYDTMKADYASRL